MGPSVDGLVGRVFGGFRLVRTIGAGGAAAVFLGQRVEPPHDMAAVKVLLPPSLATMSATQISEFRARFAREARTLGLQLHHPRILPVTDAGEDAESGLAFMVMPYVRGGTLASRIAQGAIPLEEAASYISQLADALDYAHLQGIVHRDLKPANVLLDESGLVFLADFGIAKLFDTGTTTLTDTGRAIGTPEYMAPEQAQGEAVSDATDVYGLGMIAYHLVTGNLPFPHATVGRMLVQIITLPPKPPQDYRSDLPEPAAATILQALAKQPADRFASAGVLAQAFEAGIRGLWSPGVKPLATLLFTTPPTITPAPMDAARPQGDGIADAARLADDRTKAFTTPPTVTATPGGDPASSATTVGAATVGAAAGTGTQIGRSPMGQRFLSVGLAAVFLVAITTLVIAVVLRPGVTTIFMPVAVATPTATSPFARTVTPTHVPTPRTTGGYVPSGSTSAPTPQPTPKPTPKPTNTPVPQPPDITGFWTGSQTFGSGSTRDITIQVNCESGTSFCGYVTETNGSVTLQQAFSNGTIDSSGALSFWVYWNNGETEHFWGQYDGSGPSMSGGFSSNMYDGGSWYAS